MKTGIIATLLSLALFLTTLSGCNAPADDQGRADGTPGLLGQARLAADSLLPNEAGSSGLDSAQGLASPLRVPRSNSWPASPFSGPVKDHPIRNFGMVEGGVIYRSAQPTEADYALLRSYGVKSIVNLRGEHETGKEVLAHGFQNYLWLDIEDETEPTDEQAERFLDFVADSRNWPILFHCKVGLGRTGTLAALIRYAVDGWSMDDAIKEARAYRSGTDPVKRQLNWLRQWAANHPPASHREAVQAPSSVQ